MTASFPPPSSPPPPPPPTPYGPAGGPRRLPPPPTSSGLATAAMVCGIVGALLCWSGVISVVALVLGLVAASRAKRSTDPRAGLGRARVGWILGAVGVALFVIFIGSVLIGAVADESVDVDDLDVGDCVDLPDGDGQNEVTELDEFDCAEPHDAEVFAVENVLIASDDYPGMSRITAEVQEACTGDVFRAYVGRSYAESDLDVYYLAPIEEMWERRDDREYACMAIAADGSPLTGSVAGSGR